MSKIILLKKHRDYEATPHGLHLRDGRRVEIPPMTTKGEDEGTQTTKPADAIEGKGYEVYRYGDHLLVIWSLFTAQTATFFCPLKPRPHLSPCVYLDTLVTDASQFARHKQAIRSKVCNVESIKGAQVCLSLYIADGWKDTRTTYNADMLHYVLDMPTGKVRVLSREDASDKATTRKSG